MSSKLFQIIAYTQGKKKVQNKYKHIHHHQLSKLTYKHNIKVDAWYVRDIGKSPRKVRKGVAEVPEKVRNI